MHNVILTCTASLAVLVLSLSSLLGYSPNLCMFSWKLPLFRAILYFAVEDAEELPDEKKDSALPIIPNYLANPPFPYVYNSMSSSTTSTSASSLNGRLSPSLEQHNEDCPISLPQVQAPGTTMLQHEKLSPLGSNGDMTRAMAAESPEPAVQNGHGHQMPLPPNRTLSSPVAAKQPETQPPNGSCAGPVPTFQPFFFTGTFPLSNMQGNLSC